MPETYKRRHGQDWPVIFSDVFIDLTIAKKWRLLKKEFGVTFPDPHVRLLDAAKALVPAPAFTASRWTEEHAYDFVNYAKNVTWGCAASSKSNDYGLFTVLHWIVDPYETVCLVGSTTLGALKSRTWESIVRYHAYLKNNTCGFDVPGVFSKNGYAIVNIVDENVPESQGVKASIQGRALNDGGTLQGAHLPIVLMLVDELATVADQEVIKSAMVNLRSGASDFRVFFLANPEDWSNPSCQYCEPEGGVNKVTPETGEWESTFGFHVRHHDGLKSPRIIEPGKAEEYHYLLGEKDIEETLKEAGGNADSRAYWKMVRGFPRPAATTLDTVLDFVTATARGCCDSFASTGRDFQVARGVGVDPAWSSGGDHAIWQEVDVISSAGVPLLLFRPEERLTILATSGVTPLEQMSSQVYSRILADSSIDPFNIAYDASGNQSLGGAVAMRVGVLGLEVNNSKRASESLFCVGGKPANEKYHDRASEAWAKLAEFIRAGQVRGLSHEARRQLCTRRWATKSAHTSTLAFPLRMESKEVWAARESRGGSGPKSPNEGDAAALAALVVSERFGLLPWAGAVPDIIPSGIMPGYPKGPFDPFADAAPPPSNESYTDSGDSVSGYDTPAI